MLHASAKNVVVQLPDGSRLRLPRQWTDDSGIVDDRSDEQLATFTVDGLRHLLGLVATLKERQP